VPIGRKSRAQVERARRAVYQRDNRECVSKAIYGPCSADITLQHRVGRGMGGSALYDGEAAYLVVMCARHNVAETANADYAKICRELGWSIPRWVVDQWSITEVPVFYWDGWHYLVGNDRVETTEKAARERMAEIYGGG
jgi:hypothetical protein